MPARKPHSKSRRGCQACKKRRVKCDEQRWPDGPCAACVIRHTECRYKPSVLQDQDISDHPDGAGLLTYRLSASPRHPISPASHTVPSPDTRSEPAEIPDGSCPSRTSTSTRVASIDRYQELRLMHIWSTKTCYTFGSRDPSQRAIWRSNVTNLAFDHDFLLDMIFALTAIHIASEELDPSTRFNWVNSSLQYQNSAFATFSRALQNVSRENCDAVLGFALLNMACSTVAGQLPTGIQDLVKTPLQSMLTLTDAVVSLTALITQSGPLLEGGPFEVLLGKSRESSETPTGANSAYRRPWTDGDVEGIRTSMQRLRNMVCEAETQKRKTYLNAVALLEEQFLGHTEHSIGWLYSCGLDFLEDVQAERPMALMLLMHWGVVIDQVDTMWWTQYSGKRLVEQLSHSLQGRGSSRDWYDAISWSREQVKLDHVSI